MNDKQLWQKNLRELSGRLSEQEAQAMLATSKSTRRAWRKRMSALNSHKSPVQS